MYVTSQSEYDEHHSPATKAPRLWKLADGSAKLTINELRRALLARSGVLGARQFCVVKALTLVTHLQTNRFSMRVFLARAFACAGPTIALLRIIVQATIDYAYYLPRLSNWIGREDFAFLHGRTTFYWTWATTLVRTCG